MVCEKFLQLNPQMWRPARIQHPGHVGSLMFNPAPRRCGYAIVSSEPESQLQTAQLAESLEPREVAPS